MRHFFETVFYYCYLSYKKHDDGPELRALSTITLAHCPLIYSLIYTIYIHFNINFADNPIYSWLAFSSTFIIVLFFYFMLYAKGKYKEITERKPKFCNNPKINKRIAWGYIWGIVILGVIPPFFWDTLKQLH